MHRAEAAGAHCREPENCNTRYAVQGESGGFWMWMLLCKGGKDPIKKSVTSFVNSPRLWNGILILKKLFFLSFIPFHGYSPLQAMHQIFDLKSIVCLPKYKHFFFCDRMVPFP